MATRFVIIGGGPGGHTAASHAARLGAEVTLIERDIVGGAAHLWDCIPSKAMIATGGALAAVRRSPEMGLVEATTSVDVDALRDRLRRIEERIERDTSRLLASQDVRILRGTGRFTGPNTVVADTADGAVEVEADAVLLATGSRPRLPDWATVDGDRVLSTREAYPPATWPEHLVVIGSGVTGVEFVHMFSSLGSKVTLIVSRQQVLPQKDPEVAAALEDELLRRGVSLFKGARAVGIDREGDEVVVRCDDGRAARGSHALLAIGSIPNSEELGLEAAGVHADQGGYVPVDDDCRTNVPHVFAAGDLSGRLPLSSVAVDAGAAGGRAGHGRADQGPPPGRLRQGGLGDLHGARDRRCGPGRGRRLLRGPQGPGHQGPVLGRTQGHDRRPHRVASSRSSATPPPAWCSAARSSAATPPSWWPSSPWR